MKLQILIGELASMGVAMAFALLLSALALHAGTAWLIPGTSAASQVGGAVNSSIAPYYVFKVIIR